MSPVIELTFLSVTQILWLPIIEQLKLNIDH
jgi:hypothetical protein